MTKTRRFFSIAALLLLTGIILSCVQLNHRSKIHSNIVTFSKAVTHDVSRPLASLVNIRNENEAAQSLYTTQETGKSASAGVVTTPITSESVEQTIHGTKPPPEIVVSFDGLGAGFEGPQGTARFRNPSDNSLAVGPDHIVQTVNSRMAVFTKKGARFDTTGKVLYGPVPTNNVFKGFGDADSVNNGDAVVRYDQLADRWLMPGHLKSSKIP